MNAKSWIEEHEEQLVKFGWTKKQIHGEECSSLAGSPIWKVKGITATFYNGVIQFEREGKRILWLYPASMKRAQVPGSSIGWMHTVEKRLTVHLDADEAEEIEQGNGRRFLYR